MRSDRWLRLVSPWTNEIVLHKNDEQVRAGIELAHRRASEAALNATVILRYHASMDDVLASVYLQGVRDGKDADALIQRAAEMRASKDA